MNELKQAIEKLCGDVRTVNGFVTSGDHDRIVQALTRMLEVAVRRLSIENGDKWNARGFGTAQGMKEIDMMVAEIIAAGRGEG